MSKKDSHNKERLAAIAIVIAVTVAAGYPLLLSGQFGGHSSYVDLIRSISWHEQVQQGEFFPRWMPDFYMGHGSPIFLFYAPASYVMIELVRPFFDSANSAIKITYLFLIFFSVAGMYLYGKTLGGRSGGIASAAIYGFAPYFLVDLYVRNGIAEFACFAIVPWMFLALHHAALNGRSRHILGFSVMFALLIITHNITSLIFAPIVLGFIIVLGRKRLGTMLVAYFAGLLLSAWFWLPAMMEKGLVKSTESLTGGFYHYSNHFASIAQLIAPTWGYGPSGSNADPMSRQIGLVIIISLIIAAVLYYNARSKFTPVVAKSFWLLVATFFIGTIFTTALSKPFWDHLPLLPFVQFPWRFLLLITFAGSAVGAFVPKLAAGQISSGKYVLPVAVVIALLAGAASIYYVGPQYAVHDIQNNRPHTLNSRQAALALLDNPRYVDPEMIFTRNNIRRMGVTTTSKDDYLPLTVEKNPGKYYGYLLEKTSGDIQIENKRLRRSTIRFDYVSKGGATVRCEPFYFAGWRAMLDGAQIPIRPEPVKGFILMDLPPGQGTVKLSFGSTPARTAGKIISLLAVLLMAWWLTVRNPDDEEETGK